MKIQVGECVANVLAGVTGVADLFTIAASGIAIYIFFVKRKAISSVFRLLVNYSYQITLSELRSKLDRIAEIFAKDEKERDEIINIMSEILGQIRGNPRLSFRFADEIQQITTLIENPDRLEERFKRVLVAHIREKLKHVDLENFDSLAGDRK